MTDDGDEVCAKCQHSGDDHDNPLGYCSVPNCRCVTFQSEEELLEDENDGPEELYLGGDAA